MLMLTKHDDDDATKKSAGTWITTRMSATVQGALNIGKPLLARSVARACAPQKIKFNKFSGARKVSVLWQFLYQMFKQT